MGFSIVVVTWRSAGQLERLVASMNGHLEAEPELVVVENDSGEDPEPAARAWCGELTMVREPRNVGFGAAANDGVTAARSEAVVLLNPDTEVLDDGLGRLAAAALERRAILGPRLLNPDRSPQPSASGSPVGALPWVRALLPGALHPAALRARTEPWRLERPARASWLTGACLAAPRELMCALGPFDPAIELFAEDMDLGLRAAAAGIESWFRPDLCALVHHGSASTELRFAAHEAFEMSARYRTAVLRRAYGERRERRAALAEQLHLGVRAMAKRALDRDAAARDAALLAALREARSAPALPPVDRDRGRSRPPT